MDQPVEEGTLVSQPTLGKGLPMFMQKLIVPIERYAPIVITNCFRTVSREAACPEANLSPTATRLEKRVWKFWIDVHTVPKDHLMWFCLGGSTDISLIATHRGAPTTYMEKAFGGSRIDLKIIEHSWPWLFETGMATMADINRDEAEIKKSERKVVEAPQHTFEGHTSTVNAVVYLPDGPPTAVEYTMKIYTLRPVSLVNSDLSAGEMLTNDTTSCSSSWVSFR